MAARRLLNELLSKLSTITGTEIVIFPPASWLSDAVDTLKGTSIHVGAQNTYWPSHGAYTGEISPAMLLGTADYVLVGHSERRHVFGETAEETGKKLEAILELGLKPILAIGELQDERESNRTREVLQQQLSAAFASINRLPESFVIAYEPVWAIGTGLTATPEIAQSTISDIRQMIVDRFDLTTGESCRIQYGGSVNVDTITALAAQPDIDGALVGGASLNAESFSAICHATAEAYAD